MNLFENLYGHLHDNNRPSMNFIVYHSQYRHECDIEQQQHKDEIHMLSSMKSSERHTDSSLLGSVRRRFIPPKLRAQNSTPPSTSQTTSSTSTSNAMHDAKAKMRSMTIDVRPNPARDYVTSNGKMSTGILSSLKVRNGTSSIGQVSSTERASCCQR
jgi:hypothetical protein